LARCAARDNPHVALAPQREEGTDLGGGIDAGVGVVAQHRQQVVSPAERPHAQPRAPRVLVRVLVRVRVLVLVLVAVAAVAVAAAAVVRRRLCVKPEGQGDVPQVSQARRDALDVHAVRAARDKDAQARDVLRVLGVGGGRRVSVRNVARERRHANEQRASIHVWTCGDSE